jgi:hypothetical protein
VSVQLTYTVVCCVAIPPIYVLLLFIDIVMLSKYKGVCCVCAVDIHCSVLCSYSGYICIITYYCGCVLLVCVLPITRNETVGKHEHS